MLKQNKGAPFNIIMKPELDCLVKQPSAKLESTNVLMINFLPITLGAFYRNQFFHITIQLFPIVVFEIIQVTLPNRNTKPVF